MEDIELVIKVPKEYYKAITEIPDYQCTADMLIIKNGTPLPKGHGRIGDLDALRDEISSWGMNDYEPLDFIDAIDWADTIIEADKGEADGK